MIGPCSALGAGAEEERLRFVEAALQKSIIVEEVELRVLAQAHAIREFLVDAMELTERRLLLMDVQTEAVEGAGAIAIVSRPTLGG
ncbi:hypothetical protein TVNIR_1717 [Thioalkalivibrio nitratireducens DSM 14787]|uniref:Uncharacterized protein n=1 Tax=Thioalkalivibrio nitratireducens (strain DSM 14787 / UNIQEM 213 / ALEN2) TaxID=1255043 RepID=L0DUX5_THIND|nr:hypothetical protein [Thioalkalivibrio nitratireducens]AGA33379.1 hypothetical protein TVNIR_1717 [Thioalkalivibrio nitratireducens DSM 14787]